MCALCLLDSMLSLACCTHSALQEGRDKARTIKQNVALKRSKEGHSDRMNAHSIITEKLKTLHSNSGTAGFHDGSLQAAAAAAAASSCSVPPSPSHGEHHDGDDGHDAHDAPHDDIVHLANAVASPPSAAGDDSKPGIDRKVTSPAAAAGAAGAAAAPGVLAGKPLPAAMTAQGSTSKFKPRVIQSRTARRAALGQGGAGGHVDGPETEPDAE